MDEQLDIAVDLVAALSIALAGGWLAARVRLSPIFGYVVAGLIISPLTPGFVGDAERLRLLADIGIVLLMFGIGVQFSLGDLLRSSRSIGPFAILQIVVTMALGLSVGRAMGWSSLEALFFGAAVAQSSSTVMTKLIAERGDEETRHARLAVTWSLVQDVSTVLLVVLLAVAATEQDVKPGDLALTGLKVGGFLIGVVVVGLRVVPWALEQAAAARSREVFLLAIASLALGMAAAASALGISLALGAFLAGLVVSESERSHQVLGEILPTRDVFAVLFFVAIGMLIDPAELPGGWHIFALALALIVLMKLVFVVALLLATRTPARTALLAGALLAQSAEFTFILLEAGVSEHAVSEEVFSLTLTAVAVSILLSPLLVGMAARAPIAAPQDKGTEEAPDTPFVNHAVLIGYATGGRFAADLLSRRDFHVVIVEEDKRLVDQLRERGFTCFLGSGANPVVLRRLNLQRARLLIVADPDPILAELAVQRAREINPSLAVVAQANDEEQRARLVAAGAREVVVAKREAALEMAHHALTRFGVDRTQVAAVIQRIRSRNE